MVTFEGGRPLRDETLIRNFEEAQGVRLPAAYLDVVRANDGANLDPYLCTFVNPEDGDVTVIACHTLIAFDPEYQEYLSMNGVNEDGGSVRPEGIVVFADEAGGNLFGFDYRDDRSSADPAVVILFMDNSDENFVIKVADNFTSFLESLTPEPELPLEH